MKAAKYIPLKKRSKKEQHRHYAALRTDWNGVAPVTKVIGNKKKRNPCRGPRLPVTDPEN